MPSPTTFAGRIALANEIIEGWVTIDGETIAEIGKGRSPAGAIDLNDDLLVPGLVELHTDHLESHLKPRPKVDWPVMSALLAFDAQVAAAGITTVFDCMRAGHDIDYSPHDNEITDVVAAIAKAKP